MITSRHSLKFTGQMLLAMLIICLFSSLPLSSFAGENTAEEFSCNAAVTTTGNSITINGLDAPNVILKVYNPDWSINFECNGDCPTSKTLNNLSEGRHRVSIRFYDSNWSKTCEQSQDVMVDGNTPPPPPPTSECDVNWATTNSSITINGLNTPHVIFKLFNPNWSIYTQCFDNCSDPLTVNGLTAGATYHLSYNLYDANWQQICENTVDVVISNNGASKPDLDLDRLRLPVAQGQQGTVVDYFFDLKNIGQSTANGDYTIAAFLSTDNTLSNSDVRVGEVNTGNTPVGTIQNVPGSISIPSTLAVGNYYLILSADINDDIDESNEGNNNIAAPFEVTGGTTNGESCGFFKENEASYSDGDELFRYSARETSNSYEIDLASSSLSNNPRIVTWTIDKAGNSQNIQESSIPVDPVVPNELSTDLLDDGRIRVTYSNQETGAEIWSVTTLLSPGSDFTNIGLATVSNVTVYDGFLVVGTLVYQQNGSSNNRFFQFSIKIDESGNLERKRILGEDAFDTNDFIFNINTLYSTSNGYVFNFSRPNNLAFIKFSESGRFLWITSFASDLPSNRFKDVKITEDERFIYAFNVNNQRSFIDKVRTSDGEKIYKSDISLAFDLPSFSQFSDKILLTPDGGVVAGFSYRFPGGNRTGPGYAYGKLDADGNKVWSDYFDQDPTEVFTPVLETSDGGYLFVANDDDNRQLSTFKVTDQGELTPTCDGETTGGPTTELPCDLNYTVVGNDLTISGSGLSSAHVIIKFYNPGWSRIFQCRDESCLSTINLTDLPSGVYHLDVQLFDDSWTKTCNLLEDIPVNVSTSAIVSDNSLLYFDATRNGTAANLNWVVNNSDETAYFVLERSATGDEFEVIGEMNQVANGNDALNYQLKDKAPTTGNNFYRVMQIFHNGTVRYSSIKHLIFTDHSDELLVYPNPTTNEFFLSLNTQIESSATVVIYNALGQAVQQLKLSETPAAPLRFNMNGLQNGIYQIVLHLKGGKTLSQKLVLTSL